MFNSQLNTKDASGGQMTRRFVYDMLPSWSAQRREYEELAPVWWKHQQLPRWIADTETRLATIKVEGATTRTEVEKLERAGRMDKDTAERYSALCGKLLGLQIDYQHLARLCKAHQMRYEEGLAYGLPEVTP